MKRSLLLIVLCLAAGLSTPLLAQNATVTGTVQDASGAFIPGVEVTARDNATGVETVVLTNASGAYNFASLQPGVYTFSASLASFQTSRVTNVRLETSGRVRVNFDLQVAGAATQVEVSVSADELLLESSSSVGDVLEQAEIVNLPLVSNDVLDLVQIMAGVTLTNDDVFGAEDTTFAGVNAGNVNVTRDGLSVVEQRWPNGISSVTRLNPDLVGEMKMIVAPVDAELGRGNGQVSITTRSGGNEYHGGAVWNVRNTALDANTWFNNRAPGGAIVPDWENQNQYTINFGGPIRENRTFFFVLWDQQFNKSRETENPEVLTPCARNGIFRYYDEWNNAPFNAQTTLGGTPTRAVVDANGNPLAPPESPSGVPAGAGYDNTLRYASIFGPITSLPAGGVNADCSNLTVDTGSPWDPLRDPDPTGTVDNILDIMPQPNNWDIGDGLNVAGYRFVQAQEGTNNLFGISDSVNRKQINLNIDHILNPAHKIQGSYTYERNWADAGLPLWPGGYKGINEGEPQALAINFVSTLSPSLINEFRFGMSRSGVNSIAAIDLDPDLLSLFPSYNGVTIIPNVGTGEIDFLDGGVMSANPWTNRDTNPRWTIGNTMSWARGVHAFRFGATFVMANSKLRAIGEVASNTTSGGPFYPRSDGGETALSPVNSIGNSNPAFDTGSSPEPGILGGDTDSGNQSRMEDLLGALSASLVSVTQWRFISSPTDTDWNDVFTEPESVRDIRQNEFNAFFKDDWSVTDRLTLNLGLRYDYYGVPYEENGLSARLRDGSLEMFGVSGRDFADWQNPGIRGAESGIIFVGPKSPNPGQSVYERDANNIGPAIGFSYNVPWLGEDRTVIRGGYQVNFVGGGRGDVNGDVIGQAPGSGLSSTFTNNGIYFDLEDVVNGLSVPVVPTSPPLQPIPIFDRDQQFNLFDSHLVAPYIQNLTLTLTHRLNSQLTLEGRYIGTLTRKMVAANNQININQPNFLYNGLLEAFAAARRGDESQLLDDILFGIDPGTNTPLGIVGVDPGAPTGAELLRTDSRFSSDLGDGDFPGLANTLSELSYVDAYQMAGTPPSVGKGAVLRQSTFPENFIHPNPQFGSVNLRSNLGHQNYHSFQGQVTLRPTYGVNLQATYSWSKDLARGPGGFTIPWDRSTSYWRNERNITHGLRTYGTFALPIGPNQLLFGNSSGVGARIFNANSGVPMSIEAQNMLYDEGAAHLVGSFDDFDSSGFVWNDGDPTGNIYGGKYVRGDDPQCSNPTYVAPGLACSLSAIYDSSGNPVFVHPLPGEVGNFSRRNLDSIGSWTADMAISKRTQLTEDVSFEIRVDATNMFNHPTPVQSASGFFAADGTANTSLNGGQPFGQMGAKEGNREFQLKARVDF